MKEFIIIPAYNEEKNITNVLTDLLKLVPASQIIVVNDGSTDKTSQLVQNFNHEINLFEHRVNLGKGASLKTGCDAALKLGAEILICLDGDAQHHPKEIQRFVQKIEKGNDIVFGSRIIGKGMPLVKFLGNKFLSVLINKLFHVFINDTQSGFRAFTKEAYEKIRWQSSDYTVETEMIINAAKANLKYAEIEIDTIYHDNYKGTTPVNGFGIFFKILKWKFL